MEINKHIEVPAQNPEQQKSFVVKLFFIFTFLIVLFSVLRFYVFKNYDITIEVACDPNIETCFTRDCETGECPPNNLSNYKQYIIKAFQFNRCEHDGTCAKFCLNIRNCEPIECDTEAGDMCLHN